MKKSVFAFFALTISALVSNAQNIQNNPNSNHGNKFEQLGTMLPTPNEYRSASGAPGPRYWQQKADYDIKCELDEANLKLIGSETVTYFNNAIWHFYLHALFGYIHIQMIFVVII